MYMHMYMLYCICADAHTFASRGGRGVAAVARCGVGASPDSALGAGHDMYTYDNRLTEINAYTLKLPVLSPRRSTRRPLSRSTSSLLLPGGASIASHLMPACPATTID